MTLRRWIASVAGAGGLLAFASAPAVAAPTPLLVDATEWSLALSRASVPAGTVSVQLVNRGEDDHDVRFQRLDRRGRRTGRSQSLPVTNPGQVSEQVLRLRAGRWRVWCTLDGHAARGMRATLRARG